MTWLDRLLGPEATDLPKPEGLDPDRRAAWVLWTSAVLLVLLVFSGGFEDPGDLYEGFRGLGEKTLARKMYWVAWGFFAYFAVPVAVVTLVFRESPARFGLRVHFTKRTALLYLSMIAVMIPVVVIASRAPSFIAQYPQPKDLHGELSRILAWETARSLRFVALEFFFRGYLLFGLEAKLGLNAIGVSVLPYGLIHFGKPFPEALAAVLAGTILGLFALRTRSIAGGAILHAFVASFMDVMALYRQGTFD